MTKLLIEEAEGEFAVNLQNEFFSSEIDELIKGTCLEIPHESFFIREVILTGHQIPWIYARTVIPQYTLAMQHPGLYQLGNSSLGNYLFSHASIKRQVPDIACLEENSGENNLLYHRACEILKKKSLPNLWARRSVFTLDDLPLLVSETFLPEFWGI